MTTFAFVLQVAQASRTRSTGDPSLPVPVIFNPGVTLWPAYGVALG